MHRGSVSGRHRNRALRIACCFCFFSNPFFATLISFLFRARTHTHTHTHTHTNTRAREVTKTASFRDFRDFRTTFVCAPRFQRLYTFVPILKSLDLDLRELKRIIAAEEDRLGGWSKKKFNPRVKVQFENFKKVEEDW